MPRWLRKFMAALSFAMFFGLGLVLGLVFFPVARLLTWRKERHRRLCTWMLGKGYPTFCYWMRLVGLIDYEPITLPDDLPKDRPYVLIANHPTLIDVLFCLGWFQGLTCVVKAAWFRGFLLRFLLRSTNYVAGPGLPGDDAAFAPALDRMVEQLRAGRPFVVFPEGTRSPPHGLLRFHRGPFEAAVRAGVPIVPLFIAVERPGLNKEHPLPPDYLKYTFDWLPWVDCAKEGANSKELRAQMQDAFQHRLDRYLRNEVQGFGANSLSSSASAGSAHG